MSDRTLHRSRRDLDDREAIDDLVRSFYRRAAMDDVLGPVFEAAHVDWSVHIPTLIDFWAWQLLGEPGYEGNPLLAHAPVHARTPFGEEHYDRWLELFTDTVEERFEGPSADLAVRRATKMARALRRLLEGIDDRGDRPIEPIVRRR